VVVRSYPALLLLKLPPYEGADHESSVGAGSTRGGGCVSQLAVDPTHWLADAPANSTPEKGEVNQSESPAASPAAGSPARCNANVSGMACAVMPPA
jgi:hypothetical protein